MTMGDNGARPELTAWEREVVLTALDCGYFAVPRRTPLVGVADRVGMGDKETLELLHRGIATVLTNHRAELEQVPGTDGQ